MTFVEETTFDKVYLPERVYKYRNWTNEEHKRLLTENEIYFSAPLNIDEQHECNLETDYDSVTSQMIFDYAYMRAPEFGIIDEANRNLFAKNTVNFTPFYDAAHRVSMEERFRQDLNNQLSIFCVSEQKDNLNLWDSFSGGQTGFCVGINTRKMFDNKEILGGASKVDYYPIKNMPKRKAFCFSELERIQDMLNVIFSLPDFFAKEDEYRIFKLNIKNRQAKISQESIEEIILGQFIKEEHKQEIIQIAKIRFPLAEILQSTIDYNSNVFVFTKLN